MCHRHSGVHNLPPPHLSFTFTPTCPSLLFPSLQPKRSVERKKILWWMNFPCHSKSSVKVKRRKSWQKKTKRNLEMEEKRERTGLVNFLDYNYFHICIYYLFISVWLKFLSVQECMNFYEFSGKFNFSLFFFSLCWGGCRCKLSRIGSVFFCDSYPVSLPLLSNPPWWKSDTDKE